jgi:hypothetical protein
VALSLYQSCTAEQAVAAFGDPADAELLCDRQFAVLPRATLCFATMGDPDTGTKLLTPSKVAWKPARLDYHPDDPRPWLPERLTVCVERDGAWLPLHHMFLRAPGDQEFIYAGIAHLPMFGEIPENGRIQHSAHFFLDAKLPRELWLRLGGYADWLVCFNNTTRRFADDDVAGFEQLLAGVPTTPGNWEVTLTGYEEQRLAIQFSDKRARLSYRPLHWPKRLGDEEGVEAWDPDCPEPRRREFFGKDGEIDVVYAAVRTVPRELAVRAAVEHFRTGRLPECVRWRKIQARVTVNIMFPAGRKGAGPFELKDQLADFFGPAAQFLGHGDAPDGSGDVLFEFADDENVEPWLTRLCDFLRAAGARRKTFLAVFPDGPGGEWQRVDVYGSQRHAEPGAAADGGA